MTARVYVAVIGPAECGAEALALAEAVGETLARRGAILVTGGLGGVMEAAARGARRAGGVVLGILPGEERRTGSPHLSLAVATGMGQARNTIIAHTADALIAIGGGFGTLSEIALARRLGKPVVGISTWGLAPPPGLPEPKEPGIVESANPGDAADLALALAAAASPAAPPGAERPTDRGTPGLDHVAEIRFVPPAPAAGTAGRWVATCAEAAAEADGTTLEEALRRLEATLAQRGGEPPALRIRSEPGLVMDHENGGGALRFPDSTLTLERMLHTLAAEGSLAAVTEHYPILSEEEAAAAVEFAARIVGSIRLRPLP